MTLLLVGLAGYLFGLQGCLWVGLCGRHAMLALWRKPDRTAALHELQIQQLWMVQSMVAIVAQEGRLWIMRDEVTPAQWSAMRRYLGSQCPAEPIGLSISR